MNPSGHPLAYFITFHTYGTWLHGCSAGSVDRSHNVPGTAFLPADDARRQQAAAHLDQVPYELDAARRRAVRQAICDVCGYRGWTLLAGHVRTNHAHAVVSAPVPPERVMNDFKAYASRALNAAGLDPPGRKRWSRHRSTLYLWHIDQINAKVQYTLHEQGKPMEAFDGTAVPGPGAPPPGSDAPASGP